MDVAHPVHPGCEGRSRGVVAGEQSDPARRAEVRRRGRATGLDPAESERLLDDLANFACQSPRTYHHTWTPGDAVVWDNRCLVHRACPWDMTKPRVMYHSRIAGDPVSEGWRAA